MQTSYAVTEKSRKPTGQGSDGWTGQRELAALGNKSPFRASSNAPSSLGCSGGRP
jgi:hypothetical protein